MRIRFLFIVALLLAGCGTPPPPSPKAATASSPSMALSARMTVVKAQVQTPAPALAPGQRWFVLSNDLPGTVDGVILYARRSSSAPGSGDRAVAFPMTNNFAIALETNSAWFISETTFYTNYLPVTNCVTLDDGSQDCTVDVITESAPCAEILAVPAGMLPICLGQWPDGSLGLIGCDNNNSLYQLQSSSLDGVWNTFASIQGTNGPWTFPVTNNGPAFFRTLITLNP